MFIPRRLAHFNIQTHDLEASVAFYRDVAGFNIAYERPLIQAVFFSNQNTYHDLAVMDANGPLGHDRGTALHHLAFELENEAELVDGYKKALAHGVEFTATQSHDVAHSIYLDDPDGNGVEIYADVVAAWQDVSSGVINKAKESWRPGDTPPVTEARYPVNPKIDRIETAIFHPTKTASATIVAERYSEMVDFYTRVVGLRPLLEGSDFTVLGGSLGQPDLSLFAAGSERPAGLHHVSVELPDKHELDASLLKMREQSLDPVTELDTVHKQGVYLKDPNGVLLQFYAPFELQGSVSRLNAQEALLVL